METRTTAEEINLKQLDSLVRLNIFNYGLNPGLSDSPEDALFIIKADAKTRLSELNLILGKLSNSYINILEEEFPDLSDSKRKDIFPLNLIITTYTEAPPMSIDSTLNEEIEEELKIDI